MIYRMIIMSRFSRLHNIWTDNRLPRSLKLELYTASVCSTFTHGCDAWTLKAATLRSVNGFNSRCLHRSTGRSYRDEAMSPTSNLVQAVCKRRMRWLGHILRMPENRLVRQSVCAFATDGPPYPLGQYRWTVMYLCRT